MKKGILGFIAAACVMISGCGSVGSHSVLPSSSPVEERQKLTILHIDAGEERLSGVYKTGRRETEYGVTVEKCPDNADNRQAKISTILASGDKL